LFAHKQQRENAAKSGPSSKRGANKGAKKNSGARNKIDREKPAAKKRGAATARKRLPRVKKGGGHVKKNSTGRR